MQASTYENNNDMTNKQTLFQVPSLTELSAYSVIQHNNLEGIIDVRNHDVSREFSYVSVDDKINNGFLNNLYETRQTESEEQTRQRINDHIRSIAFRKDKRLLRKQSLLKHVPFPILKIIRDLLIFLEIETCFLEQVYESPFDIQNPQNYSYRLRPIVQDYLKVMYEADYQLTHNT